MTSEEVEAYIVEQGINPDSQEAYLLRQEAAGPGETYSHPKTPYWQELLRNAPMIFGPGLGAAGLETLAGIGASAAGPSISGSATGSVAGHMAPALTSTPFSAASLPGLTSIGAPAAAGAAAAAPAIAATPMAGTPGATLPGVTGIGAAPGVSAWSRVLSSPWVMDAIGLGTTLIGSELQRRSGNAAVDKALAAQEKAAKEAQERLDRAQHTSGQVYNQQRQDFQNLANQPYQTLSSLMGINVADIGNVPFAPRPDQPYQAPGWQTPANLLPENTRPHVGAHPNNPQMRGTPIIPAGVEQGFQQAGRQAQTQSGYVRMRAPDGEEQDVQSQFVPIFERKGAVRV